MIRSGDGDRIINLQSSGTGIIKVAFYHGRLQIIHVLTWMRPFYLAASPRQIKNRSLCVLCDSAVRRSGFFPYYLSVDDSHFHFDIFYLIDRNLDWVTIQQDQIGQFAGGDRSFHPFIERRSRCVLSVHS